MKHVIEIIFTSCCVIHDRGIFIYKNFIYSVSYFRTISTLVLRTWSLGATFIFEDDILYLLHFILLSLFE